MSFDFSSVGIEYDPVAGSLLAASRTELYEVDLSTGTGTHLGTMAATNIDDLIYYAECP